MSIRRDNVFPKGQPDKTFVGSVDITGIAILWNLENGEISHIVKLEGNSAYSISNSQPIRMMAAYIVEGIIYTEFDYTEKGEKMKNIEGVVYEDEYISPSYYSTVTTYTSKNPYSNA